MSEQRAPHDVVFYCDACARRSGRRRFLAAGDQDRAMSDGWRLWLARRGGRKVTVPLYQGAEEGLFGRVAGSGDGRRRFGGRVLGACWLLRVALADVSGWVYAVWVSRAVIRRML